MADRLLVADGHGGVAERDGVESFERHPNRDEVCVEFEDGSIDYYNSADVYEVIS